MPLVSHKYRLEYDIKLTNHPEGVPQSQVGKENGATDALLVLSLLYPEDGSFSMAIAGSRDGRTGGPVTDSEIFKVWVLLAAHLSRSGELGEGKKALCSEVGRAIWEALQQARKED